jgi:hypothetical protein
MRIAGLISAAQNATSSHRVQRASLIMTPRLYVEEVGHWRARRLIIPAKKLIAFKPTVIVQQQWSSAARAATYAASM